MKKRILRTIKRIAAGFVILAAVLLVVFSWLKWFANDEVKVAVGKYFPLLMMIDNHPVDEKTYLTTTENDPAIYQTEGQSAIYPLVKIASDTNQVKELCLIDFTGDPVYHSFELQKVQQGNKDLFVLIMYANDDTVDIYHTKDFSAKEEDYAALMNKATLIETEFTNVQFDITEKGLNAGVSLQDKLGRTISFEVKENKEETERYGIIAPIGDRSNDPEFLPIIYLDNFNFIPQKNTDITVQIDGKSMEPEKLIPLFDYKQVYLSRYSGNVSNELLNPNFNGNVDPVTVLQGQNEVSYENNIYTTKSNNGHLEITKIRTNEEENQTTIRFSPAIPDFIALKDNTQIQGHFSLSIGDVNGIMGGVYTITKNNNSLTFQMNPEKGWQPMPGSLWMKTYLWNCDIKIEGRSLLVDSKWSRVKDR